MLPNQNNKLSSNSIVSRAMTDDIAKESFRNGSFVSWNSSGGRARGKIERVTRDGSIKVPDSDFTINGDSENPAALIRVWRKVKDGWEATDRLVGHKFSALSEIDSLAKMDCDHSKKMNCDHDVAKHGTHDQSVHGKGGKAPQMSKPDAAKPTRNELRDQVKEIQREKKQIMSEKSGLEREISQAQGQSTMARTAQARSSAKAQLPKLQSRLSQVNENLSDLDRNIEDVQVQISETGFFN